MVECTLEDEAIREFAGCSLTWLDAPAFFNHLIDRVQSGDRSLLIGHHNLHSLYLYQRRAEVARFYRECDDCYVDGMGAVWLLRMGGVSTRSIHRFSLMDFLPELLDIAQKNGLRIFYLGSSEQAVRRAKPWLSGRWPKLEIALHHGYVEDRADLAERINDFSPDLLLVGMGMPVQERWIMEHRSRLKVGAILQSGGTLDYFTGLQAKPPKGWSRLGLAWLYRLLRDPARLWHRYLVTPWALIGPTCRLRRSLRTRRA